MKMLSLLAGKRILKIKDCAGSSARGLMFDALKDKDGALIYGNSIWMPFCRNLDLFFLDEDFVVVGKRRAVTLTFNPRTWKIYRCSKAKYCLELRPGTAYFRIGDRVVLK